MRKKSFHSIMPMLDGEMGHILEYNLSLAKILSKNRWEFFGYVPKGSRIDSLPKNWAKILPKDSWKVKKKYFQKLSIIFKSIPIYLKIFKKASKKNDIVFLEHFTILHLIAILLSLIISKKNFNLWFLHRYLYNEKKRRLINFLHNCQIALLGKNRLNLFTDSEIIAADLQKFFRKKITVIPIPHAKMRCSESFKKEGSIYLWHPGYICRAKGILEIGKIVDMIPFSSFKLVISKQAQKELSLDGDHIIWVEKELSRKKYEMWMNTVDIVLLPYDPTVYSHGTSGIFVESILSGKMPVVKDGSWLALELKKFHLDELILDWNQNQLLVTLQQLFINKKVHNKLSKMRDHYCKYYSSENISKILDKAAK